MNKNGREQRKWKVRFAQWVERLGSGASRPVRKLLKTCTRPNVPFYTLIREWQRLFAAARVAFHPWLRDKRLKDPPQLSLFPPNPTALLP